MCASTGARLCTIDEIDSGVTQGTGCNFDLEYTWTSDWCGLGLEGGKKYVGVGKGGSAAGRKCKNPIKAYPVRCCSDVDLGAVTAAPSTTTTTHPFLSNRKDCATLGWQVTGNMCGASDKAFKDGADKCFTSLNHPDAERKCLKLGGRMCSQADVEAGVGKSTGCKFDREFVWTSTPCAGGYIQAKGKGDGRTQCREPKSKGPIRCCSDVSVSAARPTGDRGSKSDKPGAYSMYSAAEEQTGPAAGLSNSEAFWLGVTGALFVGMAGLAVSRGTVPSTHAVFDKEAAPPNEPLLRYRRQYAAHRARDSSD